VVEINSIGAEILCRIVPAGNFVVKERFGIAGTDSVSLFACLLVVKALERDILAECGEESPNIEGKVCRPDIGGVK
jgi:hypothetical protein